MSRLSIDVSGEQHQQIKALAAMQGKSIKDYILEKVFTTNNDEQKAWDELQSILVSRIDEVEKIGLSGKTFEQITNEVIQARASSL